MFPANVLLQLLAGIATNVLTEKANNPNNSLLPRDVPAITAQVKEEIKNSPEIREAAAKLEEATTPVPWYRSAVFLGSLVAVIAGILNGVWNIEVSSDTQQAIVNALPGVIAIGGSLVALISRGRSKLSPISTKIPKE